MSAIQGIKSEYSGQEPTLDLLIERYEELRDEIAYFRALTVEEPFYELANGQQVIHPATKPMIEMQKLLHATIREMAFTARLQGLKGADELEDDVESFIESVQRTNKPHRSVNRADG